MKQLGAGALLLVARASAIAAQSRPGARGGASLGVRPDLAPRSAPVPPSAPASGSATVQQTFKQYCVEGHGSKRPKAGVSVEKLIAQMSSDAVGEQAETWERVVEMLETRQMPP